MRWVLLMLSKLAWAYFYFIYFSLWLIWQLLVAHLNFYVLCAFKRGLFKSATRIDPFSSLAKFVQSSYSHKSLLFILYGLMQHENCVWCVHFLFMQLKSTVFSAGAYWQGSTNVCIYIFFSPSNFSSWGSGSSSVIIRAHLGKCSSWSLELMDRSTQINELMFGTP